MKEIHIPIIKKNNTNIGSIFNSYNQTSDRDLMMKYATNQTLTKDDLISLYDIYNIGFVTGQNEELLSELSEHRDIKSDMALIFDCSPDEITDNQEELLQHPDKYVVLLGDLQIVIPEEANYDTTFSKLKYIRGSLQYTASSIENVFPNLCAIRNNAYLLYLRSATGLEQLRSIGGSGNFFYIEDATGLENLEIIVDDASFNTLTDASMLKKLKYIMGNANFYSLVSSLGLESLVYIGGDLYSPELADPSGFKSLEYIGGRITVDLEPNDIEKVKRKIKFNSYMKNL